MNATELQLLPIKDGSESTPIAYHFLESSSEKPVFVWFCGFKSEMTSVKADAVADWAARQGAGCLRFDYSGHGQSGGRFEEGTVGRWLNQASAICEATLGDFPFVFVGSSMGGWIALLLALRLAASGAKTPNGIVLIAPAWNMTEHIWENAPEEARAALLRDGIYLRPSAYSEEPYAITKALIEDGAKHLISEGASVNTPVRILHGCQDKDIPWRHSLGLIDVLADRDIRLTLVKDAEHRLSRPRDLALLFATLAEFLDE